MPLQNRSDPFGMIHAVSARGIFTGNRGIIHDADTKLLLKRRWSSKAWIICNLEFRGVRREPMGRNGRTGGIGWTELFFLDEVTALAAGHRPCFFCRRRDATGFLAKAAGESGWSAPQIDSRLHTERAASSRKPLPTLSSAEIGRLPNGVMISIDGQPYAKQGGQLLRWSFEGYPDFVEIDDIPPSVQILTPATTIRALANGYEPLWHPTADRNRPAA